MDAGLPGGAPAGPPNSQVTPGSGSGWPWAIAASVPWDTWDALCPARYAVTFAVRTSARAQHAFHLVPVSSGSNNYEEALLNKQSNPAWLYLVCRHAS